MTNKPFLEDLGEEFGILSKGVFEARSAEQQYQIAVTNNREGREGFEVVNENNYSALYGLRTCLHPQLNSLRRWYDSGKKRFPADLSLTPNVCRAWYACDGWLAVESEANPRAMFKVTNESDRPDFLVELFSDAGFEVGLSRNAVQVPHSETVRLLDWMGEPPPEFEYKWDL